jgi:AcrR family transcriptional regulator
MENNYVDRRVKKTKKQLKTALMSLLKEKSINKITVSELTQMVDINRGTFYLHYKDIYDMLEKIEKETLDNINEVLDKNIPDKLDTQTVKNPLPVLLTEIFYYIHNNYDLCTFLLFKSENRSFLDNLKEIVRKSCLGSFIESITENNSHDKKNLKYFYSFVVSGCIGIIEVWLKDGMNYSPEHMAKITKEMIQHGALVYLNN